jgi:hypothetical protein
MTIEELLENALHNLQQGRKMYRDGARQAAAVTFEIAEEQVQAALDKLQGLEPEFEYTREK